jgi:glycosyltransferase involved in cell wall biosynthesis
MPKITALLHSSNNGQQIARALDSLQVCDELMVIDHASADETPDVARKHGASVKPATPGVEDGAYIVDAANDWILCLLPNEALAQTLQRSHSDWKAAEFDAAVGFAMGIRQETNSGWKTCPRNASC